MTKPKAKPKLLPFDAARYLTDDAAVAEYMTAVLETEDSDLLLLAPEEWRRLQRMPVLGERASTRRWRQVRSLVSIRC
jgi:DNA-binding phage protein